MTAPRGKPETTCCWYRDILGRFLEWAGDVCLDEFTLEKVREYLGFLKWPAPMNAATVYVGVTMARRPSPPHEAPSRNPLVVASN